MSTDEIEKLKSRSFLNAREPSIDPRFRPRPDRQVKLFQEDIAEEREDFESENICLENKSKASSTEGTEGINVYLRLRPVDICSISYNITESTLITRRPTSNENVPITTNNKNLMEKHYSFSAIFDSLITQCEVFERCIGQKIEYDENFTVLTYGTSGSGKTFTLLGDERNPGIIPRSLENLFTLYAKNIHPNPSVKLINARFTILDDDAISKENQTRLQLLQSCDDDEVLHLRSQEIIRSEHNFQTSEMKQVSVLIWVSFVEIYNELVYDLLSTTTNSSAFGKAGGQSTKNLKIISYDGKVFIKGLTSVYVKSSLEALKLLRCGLNRVNYAATSINANSSRSHCVFIVDVIKYFSTGLITQTSYKFCDLAGSERLHKTGNVGSRLKEAQCINTSLMVLGRCLDAANANRKRANEMIPYRESKLTMLLQAALLGKEKLNMIVNVTPIDKYFEENLNVLSFASIAKNIIFKQPAAKRISSSYSFFVECSKSEAALGAMSSDYVHQILQENENLRSEVDRLNIEVDILKSQRIADLLRQEQELRNELVDSFQVTLAENKQQFEARLQKELLIQKRLFESKMLSLKRKHELDLEELREEYDELGAVAADGSNAAPVKKRNTLN